MSIRVNNEKKEEEKNTISLKKKYDKKNVIKQKKNDYGKEKRRE